jgi:hypothetical protein
MQYRRLIEMTLTDAKQKAIESLNGSIIGSLVIGPVFIRVQRTDRHVSATQYYRFDFYRNKLDFPNQQRKLTKLEAEKMLAEV